MHDDIHAPINLANNHEFLIAPNLAIADSDNLNIYHANITINNAQDGDILFYDNDFISSNITLTTSANGISIDIDGKMSVAEYQEMLHFISIRNTNPTSSDLDREVIFTVRDQLSSSNTATMIIPVIKEVVKTINENTESGFSLITTNDFSSLYTGNLTQHIFTFSSISLINQDGQSIFNSNNLPSWLRLNSDNTISVVSAPDDANVSPGNYHYQISYNITGDNSYQNTATFDVYVTNVNDHPLAVATPINFATAIEGVVYTQVFDPTNYFTDADFTNTIFSSNNNIVKADPGESLSYKYFVRVGNTLNDITDNASNFWLSYNTTSGRFEGTSPDGNDLTIVVRAYDNSGRNNIDQNSFAEKEINLVVNNKNTAPNITSDAGINLTQFSVINSGDNGVALNPNVQIIDAENNNIKAVTILLNTTNIHDHLVVENGFDGITAVLDSSETRLVITSDSLSGLSAARFIDIINGLKFVSNDIHIGLNSRTLSITATDIFNASSVQRDIPINFTSSPPVIDVDTTLANSEPSFNISGLQILNGYVVAPNFAVNDIDDHSIQDLTASVLGLGILLVDVDSLKQLNLKAVGIGTGNLVISSLDGREVSIDNYNQAARLITMKPYTSNPLSGDRVVSFVAHDYESGLASNIEKIHIIVTNANPVITNKDLVVQETQLLGSNSVAIASNFNITDVDNITLSSASVELSGLSNGERITLNTNLLTQNNLQIDAINSSSSSTSYKITFISQNTNSVSIANYIKVIKGLLLSSENTDFNGGNIAVKYTVIDSSNNSTIYNQNITVNSLAPVIDANNRDSQTVTSDYINHTNITALKAGAIISPNISISDVDDTKLSSVKITIAQTPNPAVDNILIDQAILDLYNLQLIKSAGFYTLSGKNNAVISIDNYNLALRSLKIKNTISEFSTAERVIDIVALDREGNNLNSNITHFHLTLDNLPPTVSGNIPDKVIRETSSVGTNIVSAAEIRSVISDPEKGSLVYSIQMFKLLDANNNVIKIYLGNQIPSWLTINSANGSITTTQIPDDFNVSPLGYKYQLTIGAYDRASNSSVTTNLNLRVTNVNDNPFVSVNLDKINDATSGVKYNFSYSGSTHFDDNDLHDTIFSNNGIKVQADPNESLSFKYYVQKADGGRIDITDNNSYWLKYDSASQKFTGTPPANTGAINIIAEASDKSGIKATDTFSLKVITPNIAPIVDTDYTDGPYPIVDSTYQFVYSVVRPDNDFDNKIKYLEQGRDIVRSYGVTPHGVPLITLQDNTPFVLHFGASSNDIRSVLTTIDTRKAMGIYKIDANGHIVDARIIWGNIQPDGNNILHSLGGHENIDLLNAGIANPYNSNDVFKVQAGDTVGFFFLENLNLRGTLLDGTRVDFSNVGVSNGLATGHIGLSDSSSIGSSTYIYHASSFDMGIGYSSTKWYGLSNNDSSHNERAYTGFSNDSANKIVVGFEDNDNRDYNDIVFTLDLSSETIVNMNPAYIAKNLTITDPDSSNMLTAHIRFNGQITTGDSIIIDSFAGLTINRIGALDKIFIDGLDTGLSIVYRNNAGGIISASTAVNGNAVDIILSGSVDKHVYEDVIHHLRFFSNASYIYTGERDIKIDVVDNTNLLSNIGTIHVDVVQKVSSSGFTTYSATAEFEGTPVPVDPSDPTLFDHGTFVIVGDGPAIDSPDNQEITPDVQVTTMDPQSSWNSADIVQVDALTLDHNVAEISGVNIIDPNSPQNDNTNNGGTDVTPPVPTENVIVGTSAEDHITGTEHNDVITGMEAIDLLSGGGGADKFIYTKILDSTNANPDTILDFTKGEDKIDLHLLANSGIHSIGDLTITYDQDTDTTTISAFNPEVIHGPVIIFPSIPLGPVGLGINSLGGISLGGVSDHSVAANTTGDNPSNASVASGTANPSDTSSPEDFKLNLHGHIQLDSSDIIFG